MYRTSVKKKKISHRPTTLIGLPFPSYGLHTDSYTYKHTHSTGVISSLRPAISVTPRSCGNGGLFPSLDLILFLLFIEFLINDWAQLQLDLAIEKDWWPCQRCWNDWIWENSGGKNGTVRIENAFEEFCCEVLRWGPAITRRNVRLKISGVVLWF